MSKKFNPEARRELKQSEIEIMKGRGTNQKWFYVNTAAAAMLVVRLGRNSGYPTGITNSRSSEYIKTVYHIEETK